MAKFWFLDYVCKSVSKSRVREMCGLMELTEKETRLILERFCDRKNVNQCDFITEDQQKDLLPSLDCRVRGWIERNAGFFPLIELRGIVSFFEDRRAIEK